MTKKMFDEWQKVKMVEIDPQMMIILAFKWIGKKFVITRWKRKWTISRIYAMEKCHKNKLKLFFSFLTELFQLN